MEDEIGSVNGKSSGRIRLRRTRSVIDDDVIEENLKILKVATLPKRAAQNRYYNSNKSPMKRFAGNSKLPIHARLGTRVRRLRRGPFQYPANNNLILKTNNIRLRRQTHGRNLAQLRMQQLRQQFYQNSPGPRIRLQRSRTLNPMNYTVQVNNLPAFNQFQPCNKHSCVAELNEKFQEEIRVIQNENEHPQEEVPCVAIYTVGYGCTNVKLHDRFSI